MRVRSLGSIVLLFALASSAWGQSSGGGGSAGRAEIPQAQPQPQKVTQTIPPPPLDPLITHDPFAPLLEPWYALRRVLDRDADLRINSYYTLLYQNADHVAAGDHNAFNGRLDFNVDWTLFRHGKDTGSIGFLLRSGENIGQSQDFNLSNNIGSIAGTNSLQGGGKQAPATINLLYWRQSFADNRFAVYIGKLHPNQHIDLSPVANDESNQFLAGPFDGNASNPLQGAYTPGAALEWQVTPTVHVNAIVVDSEGQAQTGLETLKNGHFYEAVELGYQPTWFKAEKAFYRLVFWHNNTRTGDGAGVALGFDQPIGGGWVPFGRFGYGDPDATAVDLTAGLGIANTHPFNRRGDLFGLACAWLRPSDRSRHQETIVETFYRVKVTNSIEFSPDLQFVFHPALAPHVDHSIVLGARLRIIF